MKQISFVTILFTFLTTFGLSMDLVIPQDDQDLQLSSPVSKNKGASTIVVDDESSASDDEDQTGKEITNQKSSNNSLHIPDWTVPDAQTTKSSDSIVTIPPSLDITMDDEPRERTCMSSYFRCISDGCLCFSSWTDALRIVVHGTGVIVLGVGNYYSTIPATPLQTAGFILTTSALVLQGFSKEGIEAATARFKIAVGLERREAEDTRIRLLSETIVEEHKKDPTTLRKKRKKKVESTTKKDQSTKTDDKKII